jgi:hypothetical protein
MALVVEDGTVVTGAESYVDLTYLNAYWSKRNNAAWKGTTAQKEAAARIACQYLDNAYQWVGSRRQAYQPLSWPRSIYPQTMRRGRLTYWLDTDQVVVGLDTVPDLLKQAQCELALEALGGALLPSLDRGGQITSETVGQLSVTYAAGAPGSKRYPVIDLLVKPQCGRRQCPRITSVNHAGHRQTRHRRSPAGGRRLPPPDRAVRIASRFHARRFGHALHAHAATR